METLKKRNANRVEAAGVRFGKLVAIERHSKTNGGRWRWLCKCDCGGECVASISDLRNGKIISCQCWKREGSISRSHGMTGTLTYNTWQSMLARCRYKTNKDWKYYGGKGIKICKEWHEFENFFKDMGLRPDGKTLDRIDNNKGYDKDNCRWATPTEQSRNREYYSKYHKPRQIA